MKKFLILQLRPEAEASDNEFEAFLDHGGLTEDRVHRVRLDQERLPALTLDDYAGVIVGGGPGCVSDPPETKDPIEARIEADCLSLMPEITARDMPFMGCCYGISILAHHLGTEVSKGRYSEAVGAITCTLTEDGRRDPMLDGLPDEFRAIVGHKEAAQGLPEGCVQLAASNTCPMQMIRYGRNVYATQFHPELDEEGIRTRVRIYKDRGYFPPEEAEALIDRLTAEAIPHAPAILRNFVKIYG